MSRRAPVFLGVVPFVALAVLAACAAGDPVASSRGPDPVDPQALPSVPEPVRGQGMVTDLATVVVSVQPQWAPGPGGIGMRDEWGEHPVLLEPPVPVSVLAGPVMAEGEEWYQVYVLPDAMRWPGDFTAWVPATRDGADVVDMTDPTDCPDAEAGQIAALSPAGRVACFGAQTLRFVARSWLGGHWVPYEVEPAWLGTPLENTRTVSLFVAGGGEFPRPPDPRIPWVDARVPPDVAMPPADATLLVEAQFDHPEARDCRRTRDRSGPPPQPATAGLPDEPPDASRTWCRGQLVLTGWEILLGPEGRPPVAGEVQLHRTSFQGDVCAGVGLPMLRFRIDVDQPDPIWLEPQDGGLPIIPVFGPGFRTAFEPDLVVVGPRGEVVARDGTPLDPDQRLGRYAVCPGGEAVTITDP